MGGKEMVTINQQGEVGGKKQLLKGRASCDCPLFD